MPENIPEQTWFSRRKSSIDIPPLFRDAGVHAQVCDWAEALEASPTLATSVHWHENVRAEDQGREEFSTVQHESAGVVINITKEHRVHHLRLRHRIFLHACDHRL